MAKGLFIGINGLAKKVKKIYLGGGNKALKVKKIYIGDENGKAKQIYSGEVDPTQMTFTEEEFLQVIAAGKQSQMRTGALITLSNRYCSTYEVIDVNHDSTTGTVDIMSHTQVGKQVYKDTGGSYGQSNARTWINGTYFNAFSSNIRNAAKTMSVQYMTEWDSMSISNDKVKLLSMRELNASNVYYEGNPYPVFPSADRYVAVAARWRSAGSYGDNSYYWIRSYSSSNQPTVSNKGAFDGTSCFNSHGLLVVLRF